MTEMEKIKYPLFVNQGQYNFLFSLYNFMEIDDDKQKTCIPLLELKLMIKISLSTTNTINTCHNYSYSIR